LPRSQDRLSTFVLWGPSPPAGVGSFTLPSACFVPELVSTPLDPYLETAACLKALLQPRMPRWTRPAVGPPGRHQSSVPQNIPPGRASFGESNDGRHSPDLAHPGASSFLVFFCAFPDGLLLTRGFEPLFHLLGPALNANEAFPALLTRSPSFFSWESGAPAWHPV